MKMFLSTTLVALMLLLSGCATLNNRDLAVKAAYAGVAADFISTKIKLNEGCEEANPLYGKNPSDAKLAGFALANLGLVYLLEKSTANEDNAWVFWTLAALRGGVAGYNMNINCNPNQGLR